jgi:uncharacterized membrane protein YsdA (DUF1294 family)
LRPAYRFGAVTLIVAAVVALAMWRWWSWLDGAWSWLVAISLVTCLTFGYDKAVAGSGRTRVPERVLLTLAFVGGTVGALLGMWVFHHKTAKRSFQLKLAAIVFCQFVLGIGYALWLGPLLAK